jgi:hypothetical protein
MSVDFEVDEFYPGRAVMAKWTSGWGVLVDYNRTDFIEA